MKGSWFIFDTFRAHEDWCRWRAPFWHGTRVMDEKSHAPTLQPTWRREKTPVDDREALLERRVVVTEQTHLGKARPAVQKNRRGIVEAFATDHHPLVEPAETKIADLGDAARNDLAARPTEGRRPSQMFHTVAPVSYAARAPWRPVISAARPSVTSCNPYLQDSCHLFGPARRPSYRICRNSVDIRGKMPRGRGIFSTRARARVGPVT